MNSSLGNSAISVQRAIFGGSFDPVHLGHVEMVKAACRQLPLESVEWVPCYVSPFKEGTVATGEQRLEMLETALDEAEEENWRVSRFEIEREGPSYSWETAAHYFDLDPAADWHWILGTDQWNQIEQWANADFLKERLSFVVLTRNGQEVVPRDGWRSVAVPFHLEASATAIRNDFKGHLDWLSRGVAEYCREHQLYGA